MFEIRFDDTIRRAWPALKILAVTADVTNEPTGDELWTELTDLERRIRTDFAMDQVNKRAGIAATRQAYKACGKEPNRYRPSTEALCRRMVKGMDLYRSQTLIDLINLLSVASGHSIGGFDIDKITSPDGSLTIGVGREGEPYEAIHRGPLNIAGLPVLRDDRGGIGTPTSDNERTKLTADTRRLLMVINIYGDDMPLDQIKSETQRLLTTYAHASNIEMHLYHASAK